MIARFRKWLAYRRELKLWYKFKEFSEHSSSTVPEEVRFEWFKELEAKGPERVRHELETGTFQ